VEVFVAIPARGVSVPKPSVVGIDTPVFTSLGFGVESVKDGIVRYSSGICEVQSSPFFQCLSYLCITRGGAWMHPPEEPCLNDVVGSVSLGVCQATFCGDDTCFEDNCPSKKCASEHCDDLSCDDHVCGSKGKILGIADGLVTLWEHPFVQELGQYFGVDTADKLAEVVKHYVGRNMFDESAR
jgi:hypothetical protein